jgi:hypothetical protein
MQTDQATLVLASLLRSPRRFQSYDLSRAAREHISDVQQLVEEYEEKQSAADYAGALAALEKAYGMLQAEPPTETADLANWKHPVLAAADKADLAAEMDAWRALLGKLMKEKE